MVLTRNETKQNVNVNPDYYNAEGIRCIDVMLATQGKRATMDFCMCSAIKNIFRYKKKNGLEDIKKAKEYLETYIELAEMERT